VQSRCPRQSPPSFRQELPPCSKTKGQCSWDAEDMTPRTPRGPLTCTTPGSQPPPGESAARAPPSAAPPQPPMGTSTLTPRPQSPGHRGRGGRSHWIRQRPGGRRCCAPEQPQQGRWQQQHQQQHQRQQQQQQQGFPAAGQEGAYHDAFGSGRVSGPLSHSGSIKGSSRSPRGPQKPSGTPSPTAVQSPGVSKGSGSPTPLQADWEGPADQVPVPAPRLIQAEAPVSPLYYKEGWVLTGL